MQVLKKFNESAGKPNEIFIGYSPREDSYSQAQLQLRNHFLIIGRALQGVSGLTPLEIIKPGGTDLFARAAKHIVSHAIVWADVVRVMEGQAASGKLQLDEQQRSLAVYWLKEALYDEAGLSYKTE